MFIIWLGQTQLLLERTNWLLQDRHAKFVQLEQRGSIKEHEEHEVPFKKVPTKHEHEPLIKDKVDWHDKHSAELQEAHPENIELQERQLPLITVLTGD